MGKAILVGACVQACEGGWVWVVADSLFFFFASGRCFRLRARALITGANYSELGVKTTSNRPAGTSLPQYHSSPLP